MNLNTTTFALVGKANKEIFIAEVFREKERKKQQKLTLGTQNM
jgi:outer membrane lipoprotein SlyB